MVLQIITAYGNPDRFANRYPEWPKTRWFRKKACKEGAYEQVPTHGIRCDGVAGFFASDFRMPPFLRLVLLRFESHHRRTRRVSQFFASEILL